MSERPVDSSRCPLCGGDNRCAMAAADGDASRCATCWCRDVTFDERALARVPDELRGRACLCRSCALGGGDGGERDQGVGRTRD